MPHGAILNVTSLRNTFQQPTRALKIVKTSSNDLFIIPQSRGNSKSTDPISSSICFPFDLSMNLKRPIYASRDRYFRNFRRFERSYERFEDRSRLEEQEAAGSRSGWHASGGSHLKRAKISQDNRFLSFSLPLTDFHQFRLEPPLSLSSRVDSGSKRRSIHLLSFRLGEIGERRENAVHASIDWIFSTLIFECFSSRSEMVGPGKCERCAPRVAINESSSGSLKDGEEAFENGEWGWW